MRLYLAMLFLFLKIPLPSFFLDGVFVPGFMSISKAIILSSSGDQRHLVRAATRRAASRGTEGGIVADVAAAEAGSLSCCKCENAATSSKHARVSV